MIYLFLGFVVPPDDNYYDYKTLLLDAVAVAAADDNNYSYNIEAVGNVLVVLMVVVPVLVVDIDKKLDVEAAALDVARPCTHAC